MKFSTRDLLLVTVIVALALGWWADRSRLASKITMDAWNIEHLEGENEIQMKQIKELKELLLKSQAPASTPPKN